jgi:hypothetical protein
MRRDNDRFSAEILVLFKLSNLTHTAYRAPIGYAGLRGLAVRYCFYPAETT